MGGSRKGKRSKAKSKPNKTNTIKEKPRKLNSKLDLGQASSSNNPDVKYTNPKQNIDFSTTIVTRWDCVSSPAETSHPQSSGHSENEDGDDDDDDDGGVTEAFAAAKFLYGLSSDSFSKDGFSETNKHIADMERKIGVAQVIQADMERKIGVAQVIQAGKQPEDADILRSFEDPKSALIVDSVKEIRDLQVKAQKEWWAQRKVMMDSAKLQKLRMEKEKEKMKNEKLCSEMSVKLLEAEQSSFVNYVVKRMEIENDRIRAEIEAFKLNALESERELKKVMKRQTRYTKKFADVEKQTSVLRSQCEEEKQRAVQLEQELLQTEKEAKETEMKWKQTIKEKEVMLALLAQETKNAEIRKVRSRAQLQKLRQQVEIDSRLANDKCQRLENELSHIRESQSRPIEELLPENLDFLYCYDDTISLESTAPCEPSQWICMICMKNEVSVLLLPCTHQVICHLCYVKKNQAVGACCPYCGVGIENAVKVYGSSS